MLLTINIPIPQNIKQMNRKKKAAQKNKDLNLDFTWEYSKYRFCKKNILTNLSSRQLGKLFLKQIYTLTFVLQAIM